MTTYKVRMTVSYYVNGASTILSNPKTKPADRERVVSELVAIVNAATKAGLVDGLVADDDKAVGGA